MWLIKVASFKKKEAKNTHTILGAKSTNIKDSKDSKGNLFTMSTSD
jgi:hypothetical protein